MWQIKKSTFLRWKPQRRNDCASKLESYKNGKSILLRLQTNQEFPAVRWDTQLIKIRGLETIDWTKLRCGEDFFDVQSIAPTD